jgi:hypothetical protein
MIHGETLSDSMRYGTAVQEEESGEDRNVFPKDIACDHEGSCCAAFFYGYDLGSGIW